MRSLNSILDLSVEELDELIATAKDIAAHPEKYRDSCKYKKLATLFYEPSTRTRLSFEAAMLELGGSVLGFSSANSSSAAKGESMADTAKIISCYADIMAIRHPKDGAPFVASRNASVPVINAGDGMHNHPHPDPGRPSDHFPGNGTAERSDRWPVRRPEIRPHCPFPHRGHVPL